MDAVIAWLARDMTRELLVIPPPLPATATTREDKIERIAKMQWTVEYLGATIPAVRRQVGERTRDDQAGIRWLLQTLQQCQNPRHRLRQIADQLDQEDRMAEELNYVLHMADLAAQRIVAQYLRESSPATEETRAKAELQLEELQCLLRCTETVYQKLIEQ
jgi:hypothetical protein